MTINQSSTTKEAQGPKLKPCRYGRKALIEEFYDDDDPQPLFVATCEVCPVKTYDQFSVEEAARVWNTFVSAPIAPVVDDKLIERVVGAVNRSKSINSDGEWWLDVLKAKARVKKLLTASASPAAPVLHWPFAAKHENCAECAREYEPVPPRALADYKDIVAPRESNAETLVNQWIGTLQDGSRVTDEDAEDLVFRVIAYASSRLASPVAPIRCVYCDHYGNVVDGRCQEIGTVGSVLIWILPLLLLVVLPIVTILAGSLKAKYLRVTQEIHVMDLCVKNENFSRSVHLEHPLLLFGDDKIAEQRLSLPSMCGYGDAAAVWLGKFRPVSGPVMLATFVSKLTAMGKELSGSLSGVVKQNSHLRSVPFSQVSVGNIFYKQYRALTLGHDLYLPIHGIRLLRNNTQLIAHHSPLASHYVALFLINQNLGHYGGKDQHIQKISGNKLDRIGIAGNETTGYNEAANNQNSYNGPADHPATPNTYPSPPNPNPSHKPRPSILWAIAGLTMLIVGLLIYPFLLSHTLDSDIKCNTKSVDRE